MSRTGRKNKNITQKNLNISVPESYYLELNKIAQEQARPVSEVVRGFMEAFILPKIYNEPGLKYSSSDSYIEDLRGGTITAGELARKFQSIEKAGNYAITELESMARYKLQAMEVSFEREKEET